MKSLRLALLNLYEDAAHYTLLAILYLIALLPQFLANLLAKFISWVLGRVLRYRYRVIRRNLTNSFPELSTAEKDVITQDFYKHFADLLIETIQSLSMTKKRIHKRVVFDQNLIEQYARDQQNIVIVLGHLGNWEWGANRFNAAGLHQVHAIYRPLRNRPFDRIMMRIRCRFGGAVLPMKDTIRRMISNKSRLTATAFLADQSPVPEYASWHDFFNQETAFFTGFAKLARKFDYPVVYISLQKIKRGSYEMKSLVLDDNPRSCTESELVAKYVRQLELDIRKQPAFWLWSHNRWKHKRKVGNEEMSQWRYE